MTDTPERWEAVQHCDLCRGRRFEHAFDRGVDGARLQKCATCGLVFLDPRPLPDEVARWYDSSYFTGEGPISLGDQYLENADAGIRHGTEPFFQLSRRVPLKGRRLLEVGVGGGAFLVQCRQAGAEVVGLEISSFAAERVRAEYGIEVHVGSPEASTLPADGFDVVTFTDVLEHVLSPTDFLQGLTRFLRPGGLLFGLVPNLDAVGHYGQQWSGLTHHSEHLYYYRRGTLEALLRKVSLEPLECWSHGEPATDPAKGRPTAPGASWRARIRTVPGALQTVRFLRRWGRMLRAEERARRSRYARGLGHDLYVLAIKC